MLVNYLLSFAAGWIWDFGVWIGGLIVNGSWVSVYLLQSGQSRKVLDGIMLGKEGRLLRS
jgi:hypothetical protein